MLNSFQTLCLVVTTLLMAVTVCMAVYILYRNLKSVCHRRTKLSAQTGEEMKTISSTVTSTVDPDSCFTFNFDDVNSMDSSEEHSRLEDEDDISEENRNTGRDHLANWLHNSTSMDGSLNYHTVNSNNQGY